MNTQSQQSASSNLEQLFSGFPVNHRRTLKVRLEEVEKIEDNGEEECGLLVEKILGCLNPFSQYLIREV
jgi:hypothetical protein